jgi:transaldolase/glucose-6-phosphate isomerase
VVGAGFAPPPTGGGARGGLGAVAPAALLDALRQRLNGRTDPAAWASALVGLARPGDYLAVLAYFHRTPDRHARLQRLATVARSTARIATTIGYGPRFLHSTGQLHKGGAASGLFLQLLADEGEDVPIPGEPHGFSTLIAAQALGDYQVLEKRGRRVLRLHLGTRPERALEEITEAVAAAHV